MYNKSNPLPNTDWTLVDWFEAAGVVTDSDIAKEVVALALVADNDSSWTVQRINETKNGTHKRAAGIIHREDALIYITALKSVAQRTGSQLFAPARFEQDAGIFLSSAACRQKFAGPNDSEIRAIFLSTNSQQSLPEKDAYSSLRAKVQPAPPQDLFGRTQDIDRTESALSESPVVVIDGVGGDGKTALAWHTALHLIAHRRFSNFDWTTDKRNFITPDGQIIAIPASDAHETFLEKVLISVCRRFGWYDLMGSRNSKLIDGCADKLRSGRYLIVVDNLETVDAADEIVRQLLDMLTPQFRKEPISSCALITSRKQVVHPDVSNVSIVGMDTEARVPYIRHLMQQWQINDVSDAACQQIAKQTDGNPLFMQLALRRYSLMPTDTMLDELSDVLTGDKEKIFFALFGNLLNILNKYIACFAQMIAYEVTYSKDGVTIRDLQTLWQNVIAESDTVTTTFENAVQELWNNRILNSVPNGYFTMHALIRSYLMSLEDCL